MRAMPSTKCGKRIGKSTAAMSRPLAPRSWYDRSSLSGATEYEQGLPNSSFGIVEPNVAGRGFGFVAVGTAGSVAAGADGDTVARGTQGPRLRRQGRPTGPHRRRPRHPH